MQTVGLYWEFHKSTLVINWLFAIAFSIIAPLGFIQSLLVMTMTAGPVLSLFYKEITRKNEYYFYYNRGMTKFNLILVSLILNVISGLILFTVFSYVQSFRN